MTTTGDRLTAAFAEGARQIDEIPDWLERELGYAALRVDADAVAQRISTRAPANDLASFDKWRASFTDGTKVIQGVKWVDKQASTQMQHVSKEVATWAFTGAKGPLLAGIGGLVTGVVALLIDWGQAVGFGVTALIFGGTVSVGAWTNVARNAARVVPDIARGVQSGASATLAAAQNLGARSERIITAAVRPTVQQVGEGAAVTLGPSAAFIQGLRKRAAGVLYFAYFVLAIGVIVFLSGVWSGGNEYFKCHPLNPTPTFSSPYYSSSSSATDSNC